MEVPQSYTCKFLKGNKMKIFLSIADRIIPAGDDSIGGGTMETAGVADWSLQRMPVELRNRLLLFLHVIQLVGLFFGGKYFTKNSDKNKDKQLRWMESCPIKVFRMGFFGIKTYVCMGYYTREDIWRQISYEGPVIADRTYHDQSIRDLAQGKIGVTDES